MLPHGHHALTPSDAENGNGRSGANTVDPVTSRLAPSAKAFSSAAPRWVGCKTALQVLQDAHRMSAVRKHRAHLSLVIECAQSADTSAWGGRCPATSVASASPS